MSETGPAFVASVTDPSLNIHEAEGKVTLDSWTFHFQSPELIVDIPLIRLMIEMDEEVEGRICFFDEQNPQCVVSTLDPRILGHPALRKQTHTRNQINAFGSHADLKRRLKITAWCLGVLVLAAALTPFAIGVMVRLLVARIPLQWEQQLGATLLQEVKDRERFVEGDKLRNRLLLAVAPLTNGLPADRQFGFYLLDNPLPNAFALPGGHVLVNTGLLELADRPEEVAAAVAHEIAHVTRRHGFRKVLAATGPYLVFRLFVGERGGLLGALGDSSQFLVRQSYSQEFELEADDAGWDYLVKARIDPRNMAEMLFRLRGVQDHYLHGSLEAGAFSSHPATDKRIRRLEAKWKKFNQKALFQSAPEGANAGSNR